MKKRVGIITLHLGYGGVELSSINLANMLVDDYDVTIINLYKSEIAFEIDKRVKICALSNIFPNKEEIKYALKRKRIIRLVKEVIKGAIILFLRTNLVKKHLLENEYDYIISTLYIYTKLVNKMELNAIKIAIEHKHHSNDKKYIRQLISACSNIDYLIPVSDELAKFYSNLVKAQCFYIPNCIEYYPNEINFEKDKLLIAVGRLVVEKGFNDLIDVFNIVNKKHPDWNLVLVGDGNEREKLEDKIKKLNLQNHITLTGFLKKDQLNELYKKSSLYLMTSFEEAFGIVVVEAQSFGIPCIAFSTAKGVLELIDEQCGVIIEGRNISGMANAVIDLIENEDKRIELSIESYHSAKKYEFNEVKKKWLKTLKEMKKKSKRMALR